jgi:hypothetical protein
LIFCYLFIYAVVYTIEFQKRGLPHVHLILWLKKDKPLEADQIDALISAQLPDPGTDITGFEAVSTFMIHGPCGPLQPSSPCMKNGKCNKFYPKEFCEHTEVVPIAMSSMLAQITASLPTKMEFRSITHM